MEQFEASLAKAVEELRRRVGEAVLIHHDEADGVCSAAIVETALEKMGFNVKTLCLDKLFPEVLEKTLSERHVTVFSDIGSAHVEKIEGSIREDCLAVIFDHHDTQPSRRSNVLNLNPELYGYRGERDASASTVAYLFAKKVDRRLSRLSHLAVIGSVETPGEPAGFNRIALEDSLKEGVVKQSGKDFKIVAEGFGLSRINASQILTILASVGYYRGGVEKALEACLKGFTPEILSLSEKLEEERRRANKALLATIIRRGLGMKRSLQWFDSGSFFKGMGSKVLGSFTSFLSYQRIVDDSKYLIGFMKIPREIPSYGLLGRDYVKVSARAPSKLRRMIEEGIKPPLSKILPEACAEHGGFGDGHSVAASGVLPVGVEEKFLENFDGLAG
ncbi:MAG: DHH family phosphoesterase [Crenarchaeota archaeon]|nr:DHH family phosphoesterase [Thermoproteota archaeon]